MNARTKLDKLERKAAALPAAGQEDRGSSLAEEVREIDRTIKRLTAEIAEAEANMTPEELAQSRAKEEEFDKSLDGLTLDEKIACLDAEIALLEAEEREGGAG